MNCHTQDQLTVIVGSIWVSSWLPVLRVTRYHVVNFMMEKAIWQDDAASQTKENKDPNHPHPYKWVWKCILLLLGLCMSTVLATPLNAALIEHTEPKLSHTLNVRGWVFYLSFFCMFIVYACLCGSLTAHMWRPEDNLLGVGSLSCFQYILERGNWYHKCGKKSLK